MTSNLIRSSAATLTLVSAALVAFGSPLEAQLPNASAATLGLAGNNTASVRGFGAISVNPAGLGMPGSGFSLAVMPVQVRLGLDPISAQEVFDFDGILIPTATKQEWLDRVTAAGGEAGSIAAEVSGLALTLGNFGLQVSTIAVLDVNLPPGVVEAALFGNAGRTGSPVDLTLVGAATEGFAMTTTGLSFAAPVGGVVVGATGKYMVGHGLVLGRSTSGSIDSNPLGISMDFPMVTTCEELGGGDCEQDFLDGGTGVGLDLGVMMQLTGATLGASIQNVVNTFQWDETRLGYRPGSVLFEDGEFLTEYSEFPYSTAPDDFKARVEDFTFKPTLRLGAAIDVSDALTVTADLHRRLGDGGIQLGPDFHAGAGAELRALGFLYLRAGAAKVTGALQYAGGASLVLGPVNLSAAGAIQRGDLNDATFGQFTLSFGNR